MTSIGTSRSTSKRRSKVDQSTCLVGAGAGVGKGAHGLAQQPLPFFAALHQPEHPQGDADRLRSAPPLCELELLLNERLRLVVPAEQAKTFGRPAIREADEAIERANADLDDTIRQLGELGLLGQETGAQIGIRGRKRCI